MNLTVDVISDVICPWCYIGKHFPAERLNCRLVEKD
jgi:predicted DsbA family dithiol-disulfide isomerase